MSFIQPGGFRKQSSAVEISQEKIGVSSIDNSQLLPPLNGPPYQKSQQLSENISLINEKIKQLRTLQHKAHQDDDLDRAQNIAQKIKEVQGVKTQVINFELEKKKAVDRQDYDTAKVLKFEIDKFKNEIFKEESQIKSKFDSRHSVQESLRSLTPLGNIPVVQLNPLNKSGFLKVGQGFDGEVLQQSQAFSEPSQSKLNDNEQSRMQNYDSKIPSAIANSKVIDFNSVNDSDFESNIKSLKNPALKSDEEAPQILDDKTRLFAGPIFSLAQNDESVNNLFSKSWQKREQGVEYFTSNLQKFIPQTGDVAAKSISAIILVIQTSIKDKNWQVVKKSMSLYQELLKIRQQSKPDQSLIKIDTTSIQTIHNILFDKLADSNAKIRSQAHELALSVFTMGQSVMKSQQLLYKFLKKQSFLQPKAFQSAKHMAGRLRVIKAIVFEHDIMKTGLPINAAMDFIVKHCLKLSSDLSMRGLAMDIILALYQRLGYAKIQSWLDKKSLAKQYRESLRDKIPELKQSMPEKKQHEPLAKILGIDTNSNNTGINNTDSSKQKKSKQHTQKIKKIKGVPNDRTST